VSFRTTAYCHDLVANKLLDLTISTSHPTQEPHHDALRSAACALQLADIIERHPSTRLRDCSDFSGFYESTPFPVLRAGDFVNP